MTTTIDGVLVQWGDRLFYPSSRTSKATPLPRLDALTGRRAAAIRARIAATLTRRAPQVMVKVTGGGRGMGAIAAHFRYISKNGRLEIEDDRGFTREGREALHDLVEQWRYSGSLIGEVSHRREAFNIMLSMPAGTRPEFVQQAAREFAKVELRGHRWVMVTLPPRNVSLAEWSNPSKENGSDEVNESALHAGVQARGGADGQGRADHGRRVEGARDQQPDAAQLGQG